MKWNKRRILAKLKELQSAGRPLSYSSLTRRHQPLLSAAIYHFDSYRKALQKAGIEYAQIIQRPRWTKQRIISLIKQARRRGEDLHWGAVTCRNDDLKRAAYAALQPRLFEKWDRALHAAGLDAEDVAVYRTWDRNLVVFELRSRKQDGEPLSSGALQKDDPGLHAAAVRYFGHYDHALRAAKLDPQDYRKRRKWSKSLVVQLLRKFSRDNRHCTDTSIRKHSFALYGATIRLFGSFTAARNAASVSVDGKSRKKKAKGKRRK